MTSWKDERDRLVAQTLAFVQEVAAAHPVAAQRLRIDAALGQVRPTASPIDPNLASSVITAPVTASTTDMAAPTESSERGLQVCVVKDILTAGQHQSHRDTLYSAASERADIVKRVAAFKARQLQMTSERETYYEAMQSRIRLSLRNQSERDRL